MKKKQKIERMRPVPSDIPDEDLKLKHVPSPNADFPTIWEFALTFDGYAEVGDRACGIFANHVADEMPAEERKELSLKELRACLFFEQRRWRQNPSGEPDPDPKYDVEEKKHIRGLVRLIRARLKDRGDIGFLFVGRGSELPRLRVIARDRLLENVLFYDEVDSGEVPGLLAQCHIGLVALDLRHKTHNIPGKFLTYVQAGLPVLARINANNDLVGLIETEGVGRVYGDYYFAVGSILNGFSKHICPFMDRMGLINIMGKTHLDFRSLCS